MTDTDVDAPDHNALTAENEAPARARRGARGASSPSRPQRTNATVARAQERAYWLDRWHVDLNALMARPARAQFRALLRARARAAAPRAQRPSAGSRCGRLMRDGVRRHPRQGRRALARRACSPRSRASSRDEMLVIDSGSQRRLGRGSRARAGAEVLEIAPEEFGHGRTRNLGVERTRGELICFLTQDATPVPGWLAAYREAFALDERVGRGVRPAPAAPGHEPDDRARADGVLRGVRARTASRRSSARRRAGAPGFLSNVNACYRARVLGGDPLPRRRLRRGPGVRARPARRRLAGRPTTRARPCCTRTTTRGSSSCAATSTSTAGCARRSATSSRFGARSTLRARARARSPATARWMREQRRRGRAQRRAGPRARPPHHGGRRGLLGARLARRAAAASAAQRALSLEGARRRRRAAARRRRRRARRPSARASCTPRSSTSSATAARRCSTPSPGMAERERAARRGRDPAVPARQRRAQHDLPRSAASSSAAATPCSIWVHDPSGRHARRAGRRSLARADPRVLRAARGARLQGLRRLVRRRRRRSRPAGRPSTRCCALDGCRARAYLVQDHEPEFFATSAEARWARTTYGRGLYHIAASPWLRDLVRERYGGSAARLPVRRRPRRSTSPRAGRAPPRHGRLLRARRRPPRRAVPLGLLALAELHRRRPRRADRALRRREAARRRRSRTSTSASPSPEQLARALLRGDASGCACR